MENALEGIMKILAAVVGGAAMIGLVGTFIVMIYKMIKSRTNERKKKQ